MLKSTMHSMDNINGNQTILEKGVYKDQEVDVKGLPGKGRVKGADFYKETVIVEIEVPASMVLESD